MKSFFKKVLVNLVAMVSALALALVLVAALLFALAGDGEPGLPERMVLEIDLNQPVAEAPSDDPLALALGRSALSVPGIVSALERAAGDDRVRALAVRLGNGPLTLAQAQELRDAVRAFRRSGKPATAYAQMFLTSAMSNYYLAAAFDEIWLQPSGELHAAGLAVASPFLRGAIDKLGLKLQFGQRHEYKNTINALTEKGFTKPHREAIERLLRSNFETLAADIAGDRKLAVSRVVELIDHGPRTAGEALDAGLVDRLGYQDEFDGEVLEAAGPEAEFTPLARYLETTGGAYGEGQTMAVIFATGMIVPGRGDGGDGSASGIMGGETIARALREAREDPDVRAIVFRISSGGGSYVASDQIWRELANARADGLPVVVSMGSRAASGGYFVALPANRILAQPGTITGSIGVYGGKVVTRDLLDKLGISFGEVAAGKNALINSPLSEYTPAQWRWLNRSLDRVYEDFTAKVAEARGLTREQVEEVARGRVWSGADAAERGLVDQLGGFASAIAQARELAGLEPLAPVELRRFPAPRSLAEQVWGYLGGIRSLDGMAARLAIILEPLAAVDDALGRGLPAGLLVMPPLFEIDGKRLIPLSR